MGEQKGLPLAAREAGLNLVHVASMVKDGRVEFSFDKVQSR